MRRWHWSLPWRPVQRPVTVTPLQERPSHVLQVYLVVLGDALVSTGMAVTDVKTMLKEVAGSDQNFRLDEFQETMRSRIVSVFSDALATAKVPVLDIASRNRKNKVGA